MTTSHTTRHERSPEERIRAAALDRTIEASFPASDPPSTLPNSYDEQAPPRRPLGGPNRGNMRAFRRPAARRAVSAAGRRPRR
jgi:hypothetical protein